MATSLTCVGIFWALLSFTAAISCFTGFYLPFWIKGRLLDKVDAYFSTFRRCNYPKITTLGEVQIIEECGRYSRFTDIPSIWWQISTILVGIASALSLLVSITALAALCLTYVVHDGTARVGGAMQLLACLLLVCGLALYPLGWDNKEIKESCGDSATIYNIDLCNQCRPNNCSQQYCQMSNNAFCGPRCGYSGCGLVGCNNMATTPTFQRVVMCGPATWLPNYAPPNNSITIPQNCCNSSCGQC